MDTLKRPAGETTAELLHGAEVAENSIVIAFKFPSDRTN
jgi:hypothetical protein